MGGKEAANCNQHLGSLGIPVPFARVICGIAFANTQLVVLWQLFASQAQSLLLMTTVAMPVFSKKNETVSATRASVSLQQAEVKGCSGSLRGFKANGSLKGKPAIRDCGRPLAGWAADNLSDKMIVCHFL